MTDSAHEYELQQLRERILDLEGMHSDDEAANSQLRQERDAAREEVRECQQRLKKLADNIRSAVFDY